MKLSALASIIKNCGRCSQITAANGHRFISTSHAVYNMDGFACGGEVLPYLNSFVLQ